MKPIIIDMKDMSDSAEVYEAKPNRFIVLTTYTIFLLFVTAVVWMCVSKVEIVVKSNGVFRGSSVIHEVNSAVTGRIKESNVTDGQYVEEGDVLYTLDIDALSDTINRYQEEWEAATDRIEILSAYEKSLNGDASELDACIDNPYYMEFIDRRSFLYTSVLLNKGDVKGQTELHQKNIDSLSETIEEYNGRINELNEVKQCIVARNNTFDLVDSYYYSIVNSFLATYSYTASQYDNQLDEYQRQIDTYDREIDKVEENSEGSNDDMSDPEDDELERLKMQRESLISSKEMIVKEKEQALLSLELQQISTIEQQISGYRDTILSLEMNLASNEMQLESVSGVDDEAKEGVVILTEKGNVAAELLRYQELVAECENHLKSYGIQNDNCIVKASASGVFQADQQLSTGAYVQEGLRLGKIYPEMESEYYAEIYVENEDIAKLKEGQEVKFEIAAYPSSEYGYFTGVIKNIARDVSIDQSSGHAYYLVKVDCDHMMIKGKDGEEASLMNGMACQAKVLIEEQKIVRYLLEKIDLLD